MLRTVPFSFKNHSDSHQAALMKEACSCLFRAASLCQEETYQLGQSASEF